MHGDALRAKALAIFGNLYQVGIVATARIAQGSYFIDIDR
jgi:hypothetical protein